MQNSMLIGKLVYYAMMIININLDIMQTNMIIRHKIMWLCLMSATWRSHWLNTNFTNMLCKHFVHLTNMIFIYIVYQ